MTSRRIGFYTLLIVVLVLPVLVLFVKTVSLQKNGIPPSTIRSEPPSSADVPLGTYTHPAFKYTISYPGVWQFKEVISHTDNKQRFTDIVIMSPDFLPKNTSLLLNRGAEILISGNTTTLTSVENVFDSDPTIGKSAANKHTVTVYGTKALQYDINIQEDLATVTLFIINHTLYSVRFRYADINTKERLFPLYTKLLESFKM